MCSYFTPMTYWGLRKYSGEQDLIWGDNHCEHEWGDASFNPVNKKNPNRGPNSIVGKPTREANANVRDRQPVGNTCSLCGAWKGAYGLEPNPEMYVQHTIEILREIRRVLRKDGVVFWNIGDSYNGSGGEHRHDKGQSGLTNNRDKVGFVPGRNVSSLKPKDLCLIPFRVAIAAQEPYQEFTIKELADRAWLAGIVDADGCIGIHHYDRGTYHQFNPFVSVGCSDEVMVNRCASITRCNGSRQVNRPEVDGRGIKSNRPHYEWRLEGENAAKILEDIYPYLIVKEKQARIAHALWRNIQDTKDTHKGKGHKTPDGVVSDRLALWELIKKCNQREEVDVNLQPVPQHIEPGWWVRSVIIWSKNNPMPESVTDRPTESHEYILMLTKSARYYWDMEAVREVDNVATNVLEYSYGQENLFPLQKSLTDNGILPTQEQEKPQFVVQSMHQEESEIMEADSKRGGIGNQRQPEIQADRAGQKATEETRTIPTAERIQEKLSANVKRQGSQPSSMCEEESQDSYSGDTNGGGMAEYPREIPEQMRLLREQKRGSDARPCNPSQQGRSSHEREYSASLPTLQLQQSGQTTGRNLRSVWSFPTQPPFKPGIHFASFPEKLPEICIKAATPEVGCCSKCGAPWERISERTGHINKREPAHAPKSDPTKTDSTGWAPVSVATNNWQPTCKCNADKVPSVVLDPFMGAGTTLWVAKKLNRKATGFDTSKEYCELTVERIRQQVMI